MIPPSAPGSTPSLGHPGSADPRGFCFSDTRTDLLRHVTPVVSAILVDAAFFLRRSRQIFGEAPPETTAKRLHRIALDHLNDDQGRRIARLYRIFVYDAPPVIWRGHTPVSKIPINLGDSGTATWRRSFHQKLRSMRKVALRMGEVPASHVQWQLKPRVLKELTQGRRNWSTLMDDDFQLDLRQKGVDMRLGLDIASLAYKHQVNQIVLISGDADFVPAAKLARREGIDFILDPMWATIRTDLSEHVDGLRTVCPAPGGIAER